ncbi:MAG: hypothetical protein AAF597_00670, partial [Bacteroidota bacterium]
MKFPGIFSWLSAAVLTAALSLFALAKLAGCGGYEVMPSTALTPTTAPATAAQVTTANRIQIAFLLDTSSSMDGLIDQAKARLWNILNEILKA